MTDHAPLDDYGALTAPATLMIQRLLPGPIERVWAYLTESDLRRQWKEAELFVNGARQAGVPDCVSADKLTEMPNRIHVKSSTSNAPSYLGDLLGE
jgi:hypothetical protein